jgi:hypothetical protein
MYWGLRILKTWKSQAPMNGTKRDEEESGN